MSKQGEVEMPFSTLESVGIMIPLGQRMMLNTQWPTGNPQEAKLSLG